MHHFKLVAFPRCTWQQSVAGWNPIKQVWNEKSARADGDAEGNTQVSEKWNVVPIKSELGCPGVTLGVAWNMINRDDWLQKDDPTSGLKHEILANTRSPSFTKAGGLLDVDGCRRFNMQIISRQEGTEVMLSDNCLPNLNASKCQFLHSVLCPKESSRLILSQN